ncbi:hypothetical protein CW744_09100 [Staphylococcus xylosus]|nr:hypothetical protein CW744_09100 [Staphylococcus xylosus]
MKMKINIDGSLPYYYRAESQKQLINWLEQRIRYYTDEGVKKNQITIITTKTIETSILNGVVKIGNYSITNQPNNKHILFTTARKFKGLESDVIFIIDIDKDTFDSDSNRMVFYVASSRAKSQLELISLLTYGEEEEMIKNITDSQDSRRIRLQTDLGVKLIK